MSLSSQAQAAAKRTPPPRPPTLKETVLDPYSLTPSDLGGIVAWRVKLHRQTRHCTGYELEALSAIVTADLAGSSWRRHGTAAEVLAYIDWAPTHQATAERMERIPRGTVGHHLIDMRIKRVVEESREWRDTCDTYRVRNRRDRQTARAQEISIHAHDFEEVEETDTPNLMQAAVEASWVASQSERAPMSLDADELGAALAQAIGHTDTERRAVHAAIVRVTADEPTVALAAHAQKVGRALKSVRNDATDGLRLLAGMDRDELRRAIMDCAAPEGSDSSLTLEDRRLIRVMLEAIGECWQYLAHGPRRTGRLADTARSAQRLIRPTLTAAELDLLAAAREVIRGDRKQGAWIAEHAPPQAVSDLGVQCERVPVPAEHPAATPHLVAGNRYVRRLTDEQRAKVRRSARYDRGNLGAPVR